MLDLFVTGLLRSGIYILMAVGLSLVFGVMNIPNFAHGEFYMLGAYVAFFGYVFFGLDPLISIAIAAAVGFVVGALVEKSVFYTLRKKTKEEWVLNTFLVTVGLSIILQNGALAGWGAKYRGITSYWSGSLNIIGSINIPADRIVAFILAIVAVITFWLFLARTRTGRSIRAVAQDETAAMLVGIDLDRIHNLTFALSCMLAGLAGALLLSLNPAYPTMGLVPLYKAWYVVILVGLGNVTAPVVGGFIVGMLETFSYYFLGAGWQDVISLTVIIIILLVKPSGLFGTGVKGVWER